MSLARAKVIQMQRSWLGGRSMGDVVDQERREAIALLQGHGLEFAAFAMGEGRSSSWSDFIRTRSAMYAGGLRILRLYGGRGIDR